MRNSANPVVAPTSDRPRTSSERLRHIAKTLPALRTDAFKSLEVGPRLKEIKTISRPWNKLRGALNSAESVVSKAVESVRHGDSQAPTQAQAVQTQATALKRAVLSLNPVVIDKILTDRLIEGLVADPAEATGNSEFAKQLSAGLGASARGIDNAVKAMVELANALDALETAVAPVGSDLVANSRVAVSVSPLGI